MAEVNILTQSNERINTPINPMVTALTALFGMSARQLAITKGQEMPQEKYATFDSIENRLSKVITGYADVQYDRMSKYRDYDRMDAASTEVQTGLDIYAEEASQRDDKTGLRVWVEAEDKELEKLLNGMLQRVRMEYKAYGMYRNLAKYGDCFMYVQTGGYGVHDIQFIHPSRIERIQEDGLMGFKSPELAGHMPTDNRQGLFKPWDFLHIRIIAFDQESIYGRSFLENIRKTYKQLSMLETMIVIYRIAKAVQRNIFYVDVGQASVQETQILAKEYEKFLKNKQTYIDPKSNDFRQDFNPATLLQDIVWPIRSNSASKVEQLQNTTAIGPMDDLEYFRNKVRTGLNIPKDYFDGEITGAWNSKEALMLQDLRFSRKIQKLQDGLREAMVRLCQIHIGVLQKQYLDPNSFVLQLGTVSSQADRQREDILLRKAQILEILANISVTMGWNRWQWGDYLLDEIFPLPAKLRAKLMTPDPVAELEQERAEKNAAPAGGAKGASGPGGKGPAAKKTPKPPKKVTADNLRMGLRSFGYGESADELSPAADLNEEFKSAIEEDILASPDPEERMKSYLREIAEEAEKGRVKVQALGAFDKTEMEELFKEANAGTLTKIESKVLHEMGIPPGAFPKGKGYNDPLEGDDKDFIPDF